MATKADRRALKERLAKMFERVCAGDCIGKGATKWRRDFVAFQSDCAAAGIHKLRAGGTYHAPLYWQLSGARAWRQHFEKNA